jgi:hypothetical protein
MRKRTARDGAQIIPEVIGHDIRAQMALAPAVHLFRLASAAVQCAANRCVAGKRLPRIGATAIILHLGVVDLPYSVPPPSGPKRKAKAKPSRRLPKPHKAHAAKYQNITTGDVAEILEAKYAVMQTFYTAHETDVANAIENSLEGAVESLLMGGPPNLSAFGSATSQIEDLFKKFLSNQEMDALGIPGVPTMAAQRGVSHRFKNPYARRAPRPSLIDTGAYQASFTAWIS